jgi:hypothetical protein
MDWSHDLFIHMLVFEAGMIYTLELIMKLPNTSIGDTYQMQYV